MTTGRLHNRAYRSLLCLQNTLLMIVTQNRPRKSPEESYHLVTRPLAQTWDLEMKIDYSSYSFIRPLFDMQVSVLVSSLTYVLRFNGRIVICKSPLREQRREQVFVIGN